MRHATSRLGVLAAICTATALAAAQPVSTGWTYQGQLKDAGAPAAGDYDMIFVLYDAASGGSRVGPPLSFDGRLGNPPPVAVVDGFFTVELDFGTGVFTGDALWLQVAVRLTRVGGYMTLEPRQPLTAAPYALYALNSPGGGGGRWDLNGTDIHNNNSGNVGIGTDNPEAPLDVVGEILSSGPSGGSFLARNPNNPSAGVGLSWHNDVPRIRISGEGPGAGNGFDIQRTGNASLMRILSNGNVGLGTTTPAAKLHVAGVAGEDGIMFPDGTLQTTAAGPGGGVWSTHANGNDIYYRNGDVGIGTRAPAFNLHTENFVLSGIGQPPATFGLQWSQATIPATTDWLSFRVGGTNFVPVGQDGTHIIRKSGEKLHFSVEDTMNSFALTPQLTLSANGRLGIGMTSPAFPIHIQATQPYIQFDDTGGGSSWLVGVQGPVVGFNIQELGGATRFVINDGGDVGIGDITPSARLGVFKNENNGRAALNATNAGTGSAGFFATTNTSNGSPALFAASSSSAPAFATLGDAVINGDAIVNGTATVDVLEITGADIAERFPVSEKVKPGMVMEIDPDEPGKLRMSRGAYNRRVAGVVSGAGDIPTGTILGNLPGLEDAPPVALSGRVWVNCDASEAAIELGDLLTTSATPGHAMAVRDFTRSPGATIGKAMTPLAKGETGMVLVLVNLQ